MSVTSDTAGSWPQKSRDIFNHHIDSTIWDGFAFRDDDIIIATYAKSGTTWMQQIVGQLCSMGPRTCRWPRCRPGSTCGCRRRR